MPAGALVFVENATSIAATPSTAAGQDGSFNLAAEASVTDRILLHVSVAGTNEVVVELTPFFSADLKTAVVGPDTVRFTTGDGITVAVAAGTFAASARVRLDPQPTTPAALPDLFTTVYAFNLDFGGAEAQKSLLNRQVEFQGQTYWMLFDLMHLSAGSLTTEVADSFASLSQAGSVGRAQSGSVVTQRTYDPLSRLLTDTTTGRTLRSSYDDGGNEVALGYPSGPIVGRQFDALDRPARISPSSRSLATSRR